MIDDEEIVEAGDSGLCSFSKNIGILDYSKVDDCIKTAIKENIEIAYNKQLGVLSRKMTFYGDKHNVTKFKNMLRNKIEYRG